MITLFRFLVFIIILLFGTISYADVITPQEKQLIKFLAANYAFEVKSDAEFFHYGPDCYNKHLAKIPYLRIGKDIAIFTSSTSGQCSLTMIFVGELPPNIPAANTCIISAAIYTQAFTQENMLALEQFAVDLKPTPALTSLYNTVGPCLKAHRLTFEELLKMVQQSSQVQNAGLINAKP